MLWTIAVAAAVTAVTAAVLPHTLSGAHLVTAYISLFATTVSLGAIVAHLFSYEAPTRQRLVIRVMLMVPIYAIDSLWAFWDPNDAGWIDVLRDTYEAYVIYNFFWLIVDLMGGSEALLKYWAAHEPEMDHMFPLRGKMKLDKRALNLWRLFMIQYVVCSPLVTTVTFLTTAFGAYSDSSWSLENAHLYLALLRCVSVTLAFTALLYLYMSTKHHLHDEFNPTAMFMSIKAVIFLGCWQGYIVQALHAAGIFPFAAMINFICAGSEHLSCTARLTADEEVALVALDNFMTCLEMGAAVIVHQVVFDPKKFIRSPAAAPRKDLSFAERVRHAFNVLDVSHELRSAATATLSKKTR